MGKSTLDWIALILLIIGGLVWGLIAIKPDWNVIALLGATIARVVYALVGLAALYTIYYLFKE
ncbi:MAG: DUF378 domain-containing protein [Nanoarchaeota archaeon]|nr:DUF378 domain-containing protein [Nanoarchaeota archaeon]